MSAVTVVATLAAGAAIQAVAERALPAMWRKTKSRRTARHEQRERQAGNRPDHETIRSGSLAGIGMLGSGPEIRVIVACAPATAQPPAELTLPTVQAFVDATFPHVVTPGTPPVHGVKRDGLEFEGTRIDLGPVPMVRVQQNGLMEAAVSIPFVDVLSNAAASVSTTSYGSSSRS